MKFCANVPLIQKLTLFVFLHFTQWTKTEASLVLTCDKSLHWWVFWCPNRTSLDGPWKLTSCLRNANVTQIRDEDANVTLPMMLLLLPAALSNINSGWTKGVCELRHSSNFKKHWATIWRQNHCWVENGRLSAPFFLGRTRNPIVSTGERTLRWHLCRRGRLVWQWFKAK